MEIFYKDIFSILRSIGVGEIHGGAGRIGLIGVCGYRWA